MGTMTNPGQFDCATSADPDEPVFVLLARDPSAPELVDTWARTRALEPGELDQATEAEQCAAAMRTWRTNHTERCNNCAGHGRRKLDDDNEELCPTCHGTGRRLTRNHANWGGGYGPDVPPEIQVGAARYTVMVDEGEINKAALELRGGVNGKLCGHHSGAKLEIVLAPDQPPGCARDTLLHEVLHAVAFQTDVDRDWDEHGEAYVARLAPALLDLLRRNPELVKFLTAEY